MGTRYRLRAVAQLRRWNIAIARDRPGAWNPIPPASQGTMDLEAYAQPVIEFVRVHQVWAAPIVFALCFAESLAFISLLIPAWAALVGIGTLIGASELNFWPIWVAGSIGA